MAYRVIQWSSGNVGKHAIATLAARPGLELAGLYVYGEGKAGMDAGQIAGVDTLGVTATTDRHALLTAEADCVVHTPLPSLVYGENPDEDVETICELLASGKNVVSTVGYMYPKVHGEALVGRFFLASSCRGGGSGFGSSSRFASGFGSCRRCNC